MPDQQDLWAFVAYVQLPFLTAVVAIAASVAFVLHQVRPQNWSRNRPVEVAMKVAAPPLLALGAWMPLAFDLPHTDPFGVALVACLVLVSAIWTQCASAHKARG